MKMAHDATLRAFYKFDIPITDEHSIKTPDAMLSNINMLPSTSKYNVHVIQNNDVNVGIVGTCNMFVSLVSMQLYQCHHPYIPFLLV